VLEALPVEVYEASLELVRRGLVLYRGLETNSRCPTAPRDVRRPSSAEGDLEEC